MRASFDINTIDNRVCLYIHGRDTEGEICCPDQTSDGESARSNNGFISAVRVYDYSSFTTSNKLLSQKICCSSLKRDMVSFASSSSKNHWNELASSRGPHLCSEDCDCDGIRRHLCGHHPPSALPREYDYVSYRPLHTCNPREPCDPMGWSPAVRYCPTVHCCTKSSR